MGPHQSWSEAIMERAIALGDTITPTGAVGDSGAGARILAAESRAAGASTPAALTRLAVPILSVPPWRTTWVDGNHLCSCGLHMNTVMCRTGSCRANAYEPDVRQ